MRLCPLAIAATDQASDAGLVIKRVTDVVLAVTVLVLFLPFLLAIAVLIKLTSRGPVFFKQRRVGVRWQGIGGRTWSVRVFWMYKFRSMEDGADETLHRQHIRNYVEGRLPGDSSVASKLVNDSRVTRLGAFLRRTSLDELPQLINVVRGEMSLVGPRPVPEYEVAEYEVWHFERLGALPGMTGLWQLRGRGRVSFDEMIQMDIEYVRTRSFWLDLCCLVQTIPAVLLGKGAA